RPAPLFAPSVPRPADDPQSALPQPARRGPPRPAQTTTASASRTAADPAHERRIVVNALLCAITSAYLPRRDAFVGAAAVAVDGPFEELVVVAAGPAAEAPDVAARGAGAGRCGRNAGPTPTMNIAVTMMNGHRVVPGAASRSSRWPKQSLAINASS